jgi:UDP-glucose 4-epimerase
MTSEPTNVYNIGTKTTISVREIAEIVSNQMGLSPKITYTSSDRGWIGDVPRMSLSIEKLVSLGWGLELESEDAVRRTVREMVSI